MEDKVRRQHYVWRNYLRAWSNEKDIIWCLRENKIFSPNLMGIAQKRDFYKLQELNEDDIFWIEKIFVEHSPEHLQRIHKETLSMFNAPFQVLRELKKRGLSNQEFDKKSEIIINNTNEKIHTFIEDGAVPLIKKLQNKDTSFYKKEEDRYTFLNYISTQYFRTNKIKTNFINQFSKNNAKILRKMPRELESKKFNIERIWNIVVHILATNLGYNLMPLKYKLIIIENKTSQPFITGDQPLINIFAVGKQPDAPPEELDFYYPISPTVAIWLTNKHEIPNKHIKVQDVKTIDGYNHGIISESLEQIYANKKNILEKYQIKIEA